MVKLWALFGIVVTVGAIAVKLLPGLTGQWGNQWFSADIAGFLTVGPVAKTTLESDTSPSNATQVDCPALAAAELPPAADPYTNYSTTILETMAFDDAKAAEVLGVRLRTSDPGQSMEWLLRATALSNGDYHPFLWLVNNSYSEVIAHAEVDYDIVIPRYLLTRVIQLLGGPAAPVENTAEFLLSHGMPAESLAQLDAGAAQMMEKIAAIAYEVTGERMLIASRVDGSQ